MKTKVAVWTNGVCTNFRYYTIFLDHIVIMKIKYSFFCQQWATNQDNTCCFFKKLKYFKIVRQNVFLWWSHIKSQAYFPYLFFKTYNEGYEPIPPGLIVF